MRGRRNGGGEGGVIPPPAGGWWGVWGGTGGSGRYFGVIEGVNCGGYKQNTELTTGCGTAEGNINEVATKAERDIGVLPCSRPAERKGDKREKERTLLFGKADGAFHEWLFLQKDMAQPKER